MFMRDSELPSVCLRGIADNPPFCGLLCGCWRAESSVFSFFMAVPECAAATIFKASGFGIVLNHGLRSRLAEPLGMKEFPDGSPS